MAPTPPPSPRLRRPFRTPGIPALPNDLDPLIRPLCESLRTFGIHTVSSCEGHPFSETTPFRPTAPTVFFRPPAHEALPQLLAYLIAPRGWLWYMHAHGTEELALAWSLTVHGSSPFLNPDNGFLFLLEPDPNLAWKDGRQQEHLLAEAQADLVRLHTGLQLYFTHHGIPRAPR